MGVTSCSGAGDPCSLAFGWVKAAIGQADFARAFKQTFGQTPHADVVRRRVELASHLMRISEDSLSNIALAYGFTG